MRILRMVGHRDARVPDRFPKNFNLAEISRTKPEAEPLPFCVCRNHLEAVHVHIIFTVMWLQIFH